ncbi:MAG: hypothetical protein AVDCRST_MAG56-6311, partial [uncultured Cytophagales bacterium]
WSTPLGQKVFYPVCQSGKAAARSLPPTKKRNYAAGNHHEAQPVG